MHLNRVILAFDLYGTLLSPEAIGTELGELFGHEKGLAIAAIWRRYQLEYTWRLNSMGRSDSFSNVNKNALLHALAENNLEPGEEVIQRLLAAYDSLATFPDVVPALKRVASIPNVVPVMFSNGTKSMVYNSISRSEHLSAQANIFHDIITMDDVRRYKPAPEVYLHLAEKMGKESWQLGEMWLISGNPFDIVGARNVGMKAAWVDRAGQGWHDAAVPELQPTVMAPNLEDLMRIIEKSS